MIHIQHSHVHRAAIGILVILGLFGGELRAGSISGLPHFVGLADQNILSRKAAINDEVRRYRQGKHGIPPRVGKAAIRQIEQAAEEFKRKFGGSYKALYRTAVSGPEPQKSQALVQLKKLHQQVGATQEWNKLFNEWQEIINNAWKKRKKAGAIKRGVAGTQAGKKARRRAKKKGPRYKWDGFKRCYTRSFGGSCVPIAKVCRYMVEKQRLYRSVAQCKRQPR